jgi:hypothetical protein
LLAFGIELVNRGDGQAYASKKVEYDEYLSAHGLTQPPVCNSEVSTTISRRLAPKESAQTEIAPSGLLTVDSTSIQGVGSVATELIKK